MSDLVEAFGRSAYDTYDAVDALKRNPGTAGKAFDDLNQQEQLIVGLGYQWVANLIIQLFGIIDELDLAQMALTNRLEKLEKGIEDVTRGRRVRTSDSGSKARKK